MANHSAENFEARSKADLTPEDLPTAKQLLSAGVDGESPPTIIIGSMDGVTVPFDRSEISRRILGLLDQRKEANAGNTPDEA